MIIGSVNSFLYCCHLEKVRESKDRVFYKKLKKRGYIHPGSMFCAVWWREYVYVQSRLYTIMPTALKTTNTVYE